MKYSSRKKKKLYFHLYLAQVVFLICMNYNLFVRKACEMFRKTDTESQKGLQNDMDQSNI